MIQERVTKGKRKSHSQIPRNGGTAHHIGPHGEASGLVRRQKVGENMGKKLFCGFHRKRGRVNRLQWERQGK